VSATTPSREKALGVVLVVVGGLIVLVKLVPAVTLHAVLKLWPVLLIWLGWRMVRRDDHGEGETPAA
jgi:uncharacterized membrane protein